MIPVEVMKDARVKADEHLQVNKKSGWIVTGIIIMIWLAIAALIAMAVWKAFSRKAA
jgi:hypothetical protein